MVHSCWDLKPKVHVLWQNLPAVVWLCLRTLPHWLRFEHFPQSPEPPLSSSAPRIVSDAQRRPRRRRAPRRIQSHSPAPARGHWERISWSPPPPATSPWLQDVASITSVPTPGLLATGCALMGTGGSQPGKTSEPAGTVLQSAWNSNMCVWSQAAKERSVYVSEDS